MEAGNNKQPLIVVIGSLNTDLVSRAARIPDGGETIISTSFETGSGGKGANQAVACARLSRRKSNPQDGHVDVKMIGAVGDDLFGKELVKDLEQNGVDVSGVVVRKGEKSGVAVIWVEEQSGENRILISPNANYSLKPQEFLELPAPMPDLIVLQLEIPSDTTLQILKSAFHHQVEVIFNPAPAQKLPREAYKGVTHLIVNESEAAFITGTKDEGINWAQNGPPHERLLDLGVQHVIVTLGARGVCYFTAGQKELVEGRKVQVEDTTAAGDTFVGAYAAAITRQNDRDFGSMREAVIWANQAAAMTVEREGAQAAIPWLDEMV